MKMTFIFLVMAVMALGGYGHASAGITPVPGIDNVDEGFVYALGVAESGQKATTESDKSKLYIKAAINGLFELSKNVEVSVRSLMKDHIFGTSIEDTGQSLQQVIKTRGSFDLSEGLKITHLSKSYAAHEELHPGARGFDESVSYAIATGLDYGQNRLQYYQASKIRFNKSESIVPIEEEDILLNGNRIKNYENTQKELFSYLEGKGVELMVRTEWDGQKKVDRIWLEMGLPLRNIPLKTLPNEIRKTFQEISNKAHEALKTRLVGIDMEPKAMKDNNPQSLKDFNPPVWVLRGAPIDDKGKTVWGVGSSVIKDFSLQRSAANDSARHDLAGRLDFFRQSLTKSNMTADGDASIKTITSELLSGAMIVDFWIYPKTNELFSLARIDFEGFKKNLKRHKDHSEEFKKVIEEMELEIIKQGGKR